MNRKSQIIINPINASLNYNITTVFSSQSITLTIFIPINASVYFNSEQNNFTFAEFFLYSEYF